MAQKKQHEIINFVVKEVSGVDAGANKKTFYLKKQKDIKMSELLKAIENFEIKNEESIDKNLNSIQSQIEKEGGTKLSADAVTTVKAAIAMLDSVQKELPEGMRLSMDNENFTASVHVRKEEDTNAGDSTSVKKEAEEKKKPSSEGGSEVSKSAEEIKKEEAENIEKAALVKANEKLQKENQENRDRIEKLEDEGLTRKYTDIAKNKFPHIGTVEETASLLKQTAKMGDAAYKTLTESFAKANAAVEESAIYKELGSNSPSEGSAEAKIDKAAAEIKKNDPSLSIEKARIMAREQNPELVDA